MMSLPTESLPISSTELLSVRLLYSSTDILSGLVGVDPAGGVTVVTFLSDFFGTKYMSSCAKLETGSIAMINE